MSREAERPQQDAKGRVAWRRPGRPSL